MHIGYVVTEEAAAHIGVLQGLFIGPFTFLLCLMTFQMGFGFFFGYLLSAENYGL